MLTPADAGVGDFLVGIDVRGDLACGEILVSTLGARMFGDCVVDLTDGDRDLLGAGDGDLFLGDDFRERFAWVEKLISFSDSLMCGESVAALTGGDRDTLDVLDARSSCCGVLDTACACDRRARDCCTFPRKLMVSSMFISPCVSLLGAVTCSRGAVRGRSREDSLDLDRSLGLLSEWFLFLSGDSRPRERVSFDRDPLFRERLLDRRSRFRERLLDRRSRSREQLLDRRLRS